MRWVAILILFVVPPPGWAQPPLAARADLVFYGDNTEFSNPFRDGDTLLGNWARVVVAIRLGERASLEGGLLANWRYGDFERVGQLRPVLRLILQGRHSRFVFGTLTTFARDDGPGPDRAGPHGLIPPLQVETLSFTRPDEAGLQWRLDAGRARHDAWINWQRLNSPRARERFDTGVTGRVRITAPLSVRYDWHLVHQGGQRFSVGPVTDSYGAAVGPAVAVRALGLDELGAELLVAASRDVPDRGAHARRTTGRGVFARATLRHGAWRGHVILWRARDFVKDEGDRNYHALRQDGTVAGGVRDYAEAGLTRTFRPAEGVEVEASARLHRVEHDLAYSYRVLARVELAGVLRR